VPTNHTGIVFFQDLNVMSESVIEKFSYGENNIFYAFVQALTVDTMKNWVDIMFIRAIKLRISL